MSVPAIVNEGDDSIPQIIDHATAALTSVCGTPGELAGKLQVDAQLTSKGGRIRALMVSGNKRNAAFPDVPCAAELGFPEYTVTTWYGLWAPKGTPADVQARVVEEVKKASTGEDLKAAWALNGADFPNLTGAQFGGFVNGEIKRWAAVVKASGAKLD